MSGHLAENDKEQLGDMGTRQEETMILATREERDILLRAGFTGKQIEALWIVLNGFAVTRDKETTEDKGTTPPPPLSSPVYCGVRA